ncbi:MAG: serine/threonine protein kinase [Candidatus Margulisbacteria bacterium]|nr:serine/threonine protein kinase [Candidatus Margulisiibacteriota bacterium]MBU1616239.1 serine/threonine protein kinase [Candidatus Margulisiibacteriota bacterium]
MTYKADIVRRTTMVNPLARGIGNRSVNLQPGRVLGGYKLVKPLGAGAEGEVWHALTARGERSVLKIDKRPVLVPNAQPVETLAMELISGAGGHNAIVNMLGSGTEEGTSFRALELIEGQDLLETLCEVEDVQGFGLSLRRSLEILRHAADGVNFIHRLGLVHRDIKLENIMISASGEIKVIDLGLVGYFPASPEIGTRAYFSAERLRGEPIGPAADIFSLGIVFYTSLTLEHPFARQGEEYNDLATAARILEGRFSLGLYSFPKPVRALVKGMLAHSPEKRFRTCDEIIRAVDIALVSLPKEESRWGRFVRKTAWVILKQIERIIDRLPGWLVFRPK